MKNPVQQILLGAIIVAASATAANAALSFNPTYTNDFTVMPENWTTNTAPSQGADWGQLGLLGSSANIADGNLSALHTAVNAIDHSAIVAGANTSSAGGSNDYVSNNVSARWNSTLGLIQIAPGAFDDRDLMLISARARNTSASSVLGVNVSFGLSVHQPSGSSDTTAGLQFYYNTANGAAGSWIHVPELSGTVSGSLSGGTLTNFSHTLDLSGLNAGSGLASNGNILFRWAKDDVTGVDRQFGLDNVTFTAVPEPSAGLLSLGAAAGLGFIRRRRK